MSPCVNQDALASFLGESDDCAHSRTNRFPLRRRPTCSHFDSACGCARHVYCCRAAVSLSGIKNCAGFVRDFNAFACRVDD